MSFLIAGIVTMLIGYVGVKLGVLLSHLRRPDHVPRRGLRARSLPVSSRRRQPATQTSTVLAFFAVDALQNAPATFVAIICITLVAVALDALVRRGRPATPA